MVKLGVDLCDFDLWPLSLTFCMDISFVIGYNSSNLSSSSALSFLPSKQIPHQEPESHVNNLKCFVN